MVTLYNTQITSVNNFHYLHIFFKTQKLTVLASASHARNITNFDITAQATIFFVPGFEAISTLLSFMAYELALNPDIQNKLRDEVEDTCQECNGKLTYEILMKLKYMDMVVSGRNKYI